MADTEHKTTTDARFSRGKPIPENNMPTVFLGHVRDSEYAIQGASFGASSKFPIIGQGGGPDG
jgi:hypothetical protein